MESNLKYFVGAVISSAIAQDYCGASYTEAKAAGNKYVANCLADAEKAFTRVNKALTTQFKRAGAYDLVQEEIDFTYDLLAKVLGLEGENRAKVVEYIKTVTYSPR